MMPPLRYKDLLELQMEGADRKFISRTVKPEHTWSEVKKLFLSHFVHPHQAAINNAALHDLKFEGSVQQFSDQFLDLVATMHLSYTEEWVIFLYKKKLPERIREALATAEILLQALFGDCPPTLEDYINMALGVDANFKIQELREPRNRSSNPSKVKRCDYCHHEGHVEGECRKRMRALEQAKEQSAAKPTGKAPPTTASSSTATPSTTAPTSSSQPPARYKSDSRGPKCYNCNHYGHISKDCTEPKKIRMVTVESTETTTATEGESISELLTPILLNGMELHAQVDQGAGTSFIDLELAKELKLTIHAKKGNITQALSQSSKPRIGMVYGLRLQNGKKDVVVDFEVAKLEMGAKVVIGLNFFGLLGYEIRGIPFLKPTTSTLNLENSDQVKKSSYPEIKTLGPIYESWQKVLNDNAAIDPNSFCTLEDSEANLDTGDALPWFISQYPQTIAQQEAIQKGCDEWIASGRVVDAPPLCPYNNPLLGVPKYDVNGNQTATRVCLDARELNKRLIVDGTNDLPAMEMVRDHHPLHDDDEHSIQDLSTSFLQIKLKQEDQIKTAFTAPNGRRLMFVCLPFGVRNAPGHMQRIMERVLSGTGSFPYMDDVYENSPPAEHEAKVLEVLKCITYGANLRLNLKKCKWQQSVIVVLGMFRGPGGMRPDSKKL